MRIAIYGGSFDPIHHGHLILARDALEQLKLDRVIFVPAAISPHKPGRCPAPASLRREMIAAAIAGEPGFELEDCELSREGPSYSIDTAEYLRVRFPGATLLYLIGHDNVALLSTWRRIEELRKLVEFVVFDRGADTAAADSAAGAPGVGAGPGLNRRLDISATEIRQRVARMVSIRYLLPDAVRDIIERHQLYQEITH